MIPAEAFEPILRELQRRPLEMNKYRLQSGDGRSQAFGVVGRRCLPPDYSRQCWKRPELYKLLLDFAAQWVDIPFTSVTVNQNYQAAPHRDKNNKGVSFLVAFGDYSGGELEIHEGDNKGLWDIRCAPIKEDFSKVLHSVKEFKGERFSLVFYTYECKRQEWRRELPAPSVREVEGKLRFFRGDEMITNGLPHPLKKVKIEG